MDSPRHASPEMDVDDRHDDPNVKRRGRGFNIRSANRDDDDVAMDTDGVRARNFDRLDEDEDDEARAGSSKAHPDDARAAKSIEGWVILVTNIHEEATEDDLTDKFLDFGEVRSCHLNLDRRTGYVKGYALLEYDQRSEAKEAIEACRNGLTLMEQKLGADWAFVKPPPPYSHGRDGQSLSRSRGGGGGQRDGRAASPSRR
ncbi:unnamed protein product [Jaminaea pallidilutea]